MKTILTIGYTSIALPERVNVGALIETLRKGVRVQRAYKHVSHDCYFVEGDGLVEISIIQITDDKLRPAKPDPEESDTATPTQATPTKPRTIKRLNSTPELRLLGNG